MATVPIVTEVTSVELAALVSGSLLNEGLQYKNTDLGITYLALSANTYRPIAQYKSYVAQLTQSGTNAPVATIFENTIGNAIWTREDVGVYVLTLEGAFPENKTFIMVGDTMGQNTSYAADRWTAPDSIYITTYTDFLNPSSVQAPADDLLSRNPIEIRVYN